jgi:Cys-tRNA(Pro) deacylase
MSGVSGSKDMPVTPAIRALRSARAAFVGHVYPYVEHGGTRQAATALGVDEHAVVKTLVMEAHGHAGAGSRPALLLVLMHGDREVSTKRLARLLDAKSVLPASEAAVTKATGYLPGGVSPFGTRTRLPVYVEETVLDLPLVYINGGKRGFLVEIAPAVLAGLLDPVPVAVGIEEH